MSDEISDPPILFHDPTSEPSRAVHWFALEASIPLRLRYIWLARNEHHGQELLAVNPRRQVPALRHGEFCLSEATAIIRYLAEIAGESARWLGETVRERARINQLLSWYHTNLRRRGTLEYFLPVLLAPGYLGEAAPPRDQADVLRSHLRAALQQVEEFLEPGQFLGGDRVMVPDLLFASDIFAFDCDPDRELYFADLPRVLSWLDRLRSLGDYETSHRAWNAVAPLVRQRLKNGVAPGSDPGWVAGTCEQVLGTSDGDADRDRAATSLR